VSRLPVSWSGAGAVITALLLAALSLLLDWRAGLLALIALAIWCVPLRRLRRQLDAVTGSLVELAASGQITGLGDAEDALGRCAAPLRSVQQLLASRAAGLERAVRERDQALLTVSTRVRRLGDEMRAHGDAAMALAAAVSELDQYHRELGALMDSLGQATSAAGMAAADAVTATEEVSSVLPDVLSGARQPFDFMEEVSESVRAVASKILDLSSIAEEMSKSTTLMTRQVEQETTQLEQLSEQLMQEARAGVTAMNETGAGIRLVKTASVEVAGVISELGTKIAEIDRILEVIDDVAEQTNLLALNAAIIAAQAGEHGAGFAVVAGEIKELAARTRSSTREIGELTRAVQGGFRRAVQVVESAERSVGGAVALSSQAELGLSQILASAQRADAVVRNVAQRIADQARSSRVIADGIADISGAIEEIATATAEQARKSNAAVQVARRLREQIDRLDRSYVQERRTAEVARRSLERVGETAERLRALYRQQIELMIRLQPSARDTVERLRDQQRGLHLLGNSLTPGDGSLAPGAGARETDGAGDRVES
jgi:methyl-accepting chemotaxis protein